MTGIRESHSRKESVLRYRSSIYLISPRFPERQSPWLIWMILEKPWNRKTRPSWRDFLIWIQRVMNLLKVLPTLLTRSTQSTRSESGVVEIDI